MYRPEERTLLSIGVLVSGKQIAAGRALAGISQKQLAEMAGLHQKTVAHWERQRSPYGLGGYAISRILEALASVGVTFVTGLGIGVVKLSKESEAYLRACDD